MDVSEEEDNGEGEMGGRWLHPRAGVCGHTITTASVFLPVTHVLNTFISF